MSILILPRDSFDSRRCDFEVCREHNQVDGPKNYIHFHNICSRRCVMSIALFIRETVSWSTNGPQSIRNHRGGEEISSSLAWNDGKKRNEKEGKKEFSNSGQCILCLWTLLINKSPLKLSLPCVKIHQYRRRKALMHTKVVSRGLLLNFFQYFLNSPSSIAALVRD